MGTGKEVADNGDENKINFIRNHSCTILSALHALRGLLLIGTVQYFIEIFTSFL